MRTGAFKAYSVKRPALLWGKRAGLARFLSEMTLIRRLRRRRRRWWKIAHLARHRHGAMIASHHWARRRQCLALIRRQCGIESGEGGAFGIQIGDTLLRHRFLARHARPRSG